MTIPIRVQTIGDQMPWYVSTMDATERLCALIPDALWNWRPEAQDGAAMASLGEIAMYCADERHAQAQMLTGEVDNAVFFTLTPGEDGINAFRPGVTRAHVLASLQMARRILDRYAALPADRLTEVTAGSKAAYARQTETLKTRGVDTARMESRGTPGIFRVLMGVACHEAGHRGTLGTLLRMKGVRLSLE